ncbi:MAG: Maf-like protein [Bacilli bacterium]|jgi:septum formation protein|nr:Maf-like protein [Bacilli bacterium]
MRTLILASSSPRRQELIRTLQMPVSIRVSHADETVPLGMAPSEIVETLSLRKALAVIEGSSDLSDGIVIGSDTIVVCEGQVLNKPIDAEDAMRMLTLLQGRSHQVFSGIACVDLMSGKQMVCHRITKVTMRKLSLQQINRYIASGEPSDKAGAYAIQGLGATIIESIQGCYFNVVGLPLSLLSEMLSELGVEVL